MIYIEKRKWVSFVIMIALILSGILYARYAVLNALARERQEDAKTSLSLFYSNLSAQFENLNYTSQLLYAVDEEGEVDIELFSDMSRELRKEHEEIVFLSYFEGDKLRTILPEDEYAEVRGKDLYEFSYSYTLAKVTKADVIEGPEQITTSNETVFLFVKPIVVGDEYKGEIVAALDNDYVKSKMGLELLEEGNYDYELWRVNEIGEHKTIIAASEENVDFSNALKLEFNLPSNWNVSIIPKGGWSPLTQEMIVDACCMFVGLIIFGFIVFTYRYLYQREELCKVRYTEPDSGLFGMEGFSHYVNQRIWKHKGTELCILYIRLSNFQKMSMAVSRTEVLEYLGQVHKKIKDIFPDDTLSARLSDEVFAAAIFQSEEKVNEMVEEFVLQLYWKKLIDGKKSFVNPEYWVVTYPADGDDAAKLLEHAIEVAAGNLTQNEIETS